MNEISEDSLARVETTRVFTLATSCLRLFALSVYKSAPRGLSTLLDSRLKEISCLHGSRIPRADAALGMPEMKLKLLLFYPLFGS